MQYFLSGQKVGLRSLNEEDVGTWHTWFNDGEVTRFMNKGFFPNLESNQINFLNKISQSQSDLQLGIVEKKSSNLVGIVGLHEINWIHRNAKMSVLIGSRNSWGAGLATEAIYLLTEHAFSKLNLHKVFSGVWEGNIGSQRAFEKMGYVVEGCLKDKFFFEGRYVNELQLGLSSADWIRRTVYAGPNVKSLSLKKNTLVS